MTYLTPGSVVFWKNESWRLLDIPEVNRVLLKHPKTGRAELVEASELKLTSEDRQSVGLMSISQEIWEKAHEQFTFLRPLLRKGKRERTYEEIDAVAKHFGKSRVTIYRWLNKIDGDIQVTALLRGKRKDLGSSRLKKEVDDIITNKINNFYLVKERPSVVELWEQIVLDCREKRIKPPSIGTVSRRVHQVEDRLVMTRRYSHKKARDTFEPLHGSFPNADVPFAVYQIDHTPADITIVDDVYREPIGRPYLTIVTDTCTRMLAGFCLTLDNPGALSAGLALSHAILPKKAWLTKHNITTDWPIYGIPHKIYVDNAKEFRGKMLGRACQEYGIILENRPKGQPHYGGHVERLFRTFMRRVQSLPGTTFSNVKERGEYKSEKNAILTLDEFEHWFGIFVTKVYHQKRHRGICDTPPIKLFEKFILGDDTTKGIGLPAPIRDERKLRLDLTPFEERTIQQYGVRFDNIHYYSDVLKPWVSLHDDENTKLKRKYIFARDPRNISVVYFLDPETNQYFDIPYGDTTRPPISLWELQASIKKAKEDPSRHVNEDVIFDGIHEMNQIREKAAKQTKTTKAVRRATQRIKNSHKNTVQEPTKTPPTEPTTDWYDLKPFDIEEAE